MTDAVEILRKLVALKRLHDQIESAERSGDSNFIEGRPLPFARDEYDKRKAVAWAAAFEIVDGIVA